jgi:hypothetical protein
VENVFITFEITVNNITRIKFKYIKQYARRVKRRDANNSKIIPCGSSGVSSALFHLNVCTYIHGQHTHTHTRMHARTHYHIYNIIIYVFVLLPTGIYIVPIYYYIYLYFFFFSQNLFTIVLSILPAPYVCLCRLLKTTGRRSSHPALIPTPVPGTGRLMHVRVRREISMT